jgi:RNA polymerase sigma-70 factor, ECF subfamily
MTLEALAAAELIRVCTEGGDDLAWAEFIRRFHRTIAATVVRSCRGSGVTDSGVMDDLIQEAYTKLCDKNCRILRDFDEQHENSIFGLLKSVAYSVVQDHFRAKAAEKRGGNLEVLPLHEGLSASAAGAEQIERAVLIDEIESRLKSFSTRDRSIFWLYFRQGLTSRAIAGLPAIGLSQKGVETALLRVARQLRAQIVGTRKSNPEGKTPDTPFM